MSWIRARATASFTEAAAPDEAAPLYETFCAALAGLGVTVGRGVFGARTAVDLVNDGPVTIVFDVGDRHE